MGNIIELQGLKRTFKGKVRAVDDVNLNVREGEFVTLLGPSGCGKTTTLRMIGGFEYPDEGRVLLDGEDVTELPPYHRPVNLVFQDFALFPHMTVAQNVGYGLRIAGMQKNDIDGRVSEILRLVDLPEKAGSRPAELSNGQKQRVALARALIRRPRVLLLDEPLSALDLKLREAMQVEIKHLHEKIGITFIMVTHDQTEALVMSDRIVVMNEGRIVQEGTPAELYDQPATPYVANFIGSSNLVPAEVVEVGSGAIVGRMGEKRITAATNGLAVEVGAPITFCIRPEKIHLLDPDDAVPEGFTTVGGVVNEYFFHGSAVRVAVDLGEGVTFMVDQRLAATLGQSDLPDAGKAVNLAYDPANVIVFAGAEPS
jgi:putative spermidine/putrescine transport system ATP-binding protein/spermidine/putrescine transport system ATP-binding protein